MPSAPCAILRSAEPYVTLARAAALLTPTERPPAGVHPLAVGGRRRRGRTVRVDRRRSRWSARARVGERTVLHPHVVVGRRRRGRSRLPPPRARLNSRALHGRRPRGRPERRGDRQRRLRLCDARRRHPRQDSRRPGRSIIEDDVEIGANTAIDRPAVGETRIQAGTKIDNLVQIGHGVVLGRNVLLAAQVGIAGSTKVGSNVCSAARSASAAT